jgi:hypothetical protein
MDLASRFDIGKDGFMFIGLIAFAIVISYPISGYISNKIIEKVEFQSLSQSYQTYDKLKQVYILQSKIKPSQLDANYMVKVINIPKIENIKNDDKDIKQLPDLKELVKNLPPPNANNIPMTNQIKLQSIFISKSESFVIINNTILKEGQQIQDYRIVKIFEDKVEIKNVKTGEIKWLKLFQ